MPEAYFTDSSANYNTAHDFAVRDALYTTITAASGRLASNGNYPIKIIQAKAKLASVSNATRYVTLTLCSTASGASNQTGAARGSCTFTTTYASSGSATPILGYQTIDARISSSTGSFSMGIFMDASYSIWIGNDAVSGGIDIGTSTGRKMWGQYKYVTVPAKPTGVSASANQTDQTITVSWTAVSDWGDSTTGRGYRVEVSTSSSFSSLVAYDDAVSSSSTSKTFTISGNTGTTYYARVYAYNEIKDFNNSPKSVASATASVLLNPPVAAPTWSDSMPNTARVGVSYYGVATASSTTTLTLSTPTNTLSTFGLAVTESGNSYIGSGTNLGRPTKSGTATLTMRAEDTYGQTKDLVNNITVYSPYTPSLSSTSFSSGTANESYSSQSITANYAASVSAAWRDGINPGGLSISTSSATSSSDAKITISSGTISSNAGGTYYIDVSMTGFADGGGSAPTSTGTITLYVNPLPVPSWSDTNIDVIAAINQPYSSNVSAVNADLYSIYGNPSWLNLNESTGELSGTPGYQDVNYGLSEAQKEFTIEASNAVETISEVFSIDVVHPTKIYKDSIGDFAYPTQQVERFDATANDFVPVQWIKKYNSDTETWDHIDLI